MPASPSDAATALFPGWRIAGAASALAAVAFGLWGCGGDMDAGQQGVPPHGEERHRLAGTVVAVYPERGTLLVDHEEIPGCMPRMAMEFAVGPGDLALARPGMAIRAFLFRANGVYGLERIWPAEGEAERAVTEAARLLRGDTLERGRNAFREVGESLPGFVLYDQDGRVVEAARFRGRQLVLAFIFTRCPDPKMCPATIAKMIRLQAMAREAGVNDFELAAITLDPQFDTPGVLREFADSRGIDRSNFSLLTGPEGAIKDLMAQLGIIVFSEGSLLEHTLSIVLTDQEGRIVHRVEGTRWEPADFAPRLRRPAGRTVAQ
jgi:protein SCO1/2